MYYVYIKNIGVLKKIKPYKLYGIYKTASETNIAISELNISQENILIKHNGKVIDYIELVENLNNNKIDCIKKSIDRIKKSIDTIQENSYMKTYDPNTNMYDKKEDLPICDDLSLTPTIEKNHLTYYISEHETNEDIFTIYVDDDDVSVTLSDIEKFSELIDNNEIFKFEVYSLKSVRKIINTKTLNKEEIYKTLTSIFIKSIEENIINITEG